jgi:hypothetical protein
MGIPGAKKPDLADEELIEVRWRFVRFSRNAHEQAFSRFAASEQGR